MKTIQVQAVIAGIRSKLDKSLGLTLHTPELSSKERALFMDLQGINVDLTITPIDDNPEGVETINKELESKTQSQRIRACLYRYWEQQGKEGDFETFYKQKTEKIIESIKDKLEQ